MPVRGGRMPTIEITIRDDDGHIIRSTADQPYTLSLEQKTLHDIEGSVEQFKQQTLPEIEKTLLETTQTQFTNEKKNS